MSFGSGETHSIPFASPDDWVRFVSVSMEGLGSFDAAYRGLENREFARGSIRFLEIGTIMVVDPRIGFVFPDRRKPEIRRSIRRRQRSGYGLRPRWVRFGSISRPASESIDRALGSFGVAVRTGGSSLQRNPGGPG